MASVWCYTAQAQKDASEKPSRVDEKPSRTGESPGRAGQSALSGTALRAEEVLKSACQYLASAPQQFSF
ncbi:MAG: hypothetical protein C5B50_20335 [Verrucomicrobia bacterium]|nr:MAG: hypothetical protein C5B50_20335 [Verrucomicrobiota bacterium]